MEVLLTEELQKKWAPVIESEDVVEIKDPIVRRCTIRLLENQEKDLKEATVAGDMQNWDPVLISLVRRTMPALIHHDIVGVQPMTGPTGLIFALKAYYGPTPGGTEALGINEPDRSYSGKYTTQQAEDLGVGAEVDATGGTNEPVVQTNPWPEMSFSIEKQSVTAKSRALKAKYTEELAQDLKAIHGLDAETELSNILSAELVAEMNRELVYEINDQAKPGALGTAVPGIFDIAADADGRWSFEKYKTLLQQINKEGNLIARETRRGLGNWIITSADVASALEMAGNFSEASAGFSNISHDGGVGITYAGVLNKRYKVYIDPWAATDYVTVGYKGANVYDAGMFFAPYVPLNMVKGMGEEDFQPRIGFKTRYGLAYNPFVSGTSAQNTYYRTFTVANL